MPDHEMIIQELIRCACAWAPEARLVGNVKAGDIADACYELLHKRKELRAENERLRKELAEARKCAVK
jgi:hypothetical protein